MDVLETLAFTGLGGDMLRHNAEHIQVGPTLLIRSNVERARASYQVSWYIARCVR